mmetsp:Transcript_21096/g.31833  ORF Transcript_21096/g.31833 Transcript_21096/m.31833 type:complete len:218 (-) Transcript_21096:792-1445(-)
MPWPGQHSSSLNKMDVPSPDVHEGTNSELTNLYQEGQSTLVDSLPLLLEYSICHHPTTQHIIPRAYHQKKSLPSCFARRGILSMTASRIRHLPSSAKSSIAGSNDWCKRSVPITSLSSDKDDIILRRTSELESRNSNNMGGNKFDTDASFPNKGANSVATIANAARTLTLSSSVNPTKRVTNRCATGIRRVFLFSSSSSSISIPLSESLPAPDHPAG